LLALGLHERAIELLREAQGLLHALTDQVSEIVCWGLLASAHTAGGDLNAATSAAQAADALLRRTRPTVFLIIHGYEGVIATHLALAKQAPTRSEPTVRAALRAAAVACSRLASATRLFPALAPALWRCRGGILAVAGRERRAVNAYRRSLDAATTLGMRLDAALAHAALARVLPQRSSGQALHARAAHELLQAMGRAEPPPGVAGASPESHDAAAARSVHSP
jgi:hypothetical protein